MQQLVSKRHCCTDKTKQMLLVLILKLGMLSELSKEKISLDK